MRPCAVVRLILDELGLQDLAIIGALLVGFLEQSLVRGICGEICYEGWSHIHEVGPTIENESKE